MHSPLEHRIAFITGGAGMIGAATARLLAERGAKVILADRPGANWSDTLAGQFETLEADVVNSDAMAECAAKVIEKFGRIDIFFNNAGIEGPQHLIEDYPTADFERVLAVNVVGVFNGLKAVMPHMKSNGAGSIINTSSIAGLLGAPNMAGYITSKHAVLGLTKVAALEGAPHGVRVNAVHPGFIESRMLNDISTRLGGSAEHLVSAVPAGRLGTVTDVAGAVAFLASDDSAYMNGSSVVVDGGVVIN